MPKNQRLHFKDIPALRAMAFLPIYLFCILFLISASETGVLSDITTIIGKIARNSLDFFFFLSAFLITSHGLREYKYYDRFCLRNFYIRRFFRVGVVLLLAMLFTFIVDPWLIKILALDLKLVVQPTIEPFIALVPNYFSSFSGDHFVYLKVITSIFMFIQFYVFWGIILKFFYRYLAVIGLVLIGIGILSRILHLYNETEYLLDTLAYSTPIGIGCLYAIAIRNGWAFTTKMKEFSKSTNSFIYVVGVAILLAGYLVFSQSYLSALIPLFTSLFFGYIIIEQTFGKSSFVRFKTKKVLTQIGIISYGLIIYQAIINVLVIVAVDSIDFKLDSFLKIAMVVIGALIGSVITANISYKLLEKPLLRIRREFKKV